MKGLIPDWLWERRQVFTRSPVFAPLARTGLRLFSRSRRGCRCQLSRKRVQQLPFLNVGCGRQPRSESVNLDYCWYPGVDLVWDITWGLPFETGRFDGIFTEHCLVLLPIEKVPALFGEFLRVLKPGGVLRIVDVDGAFYLELYRRAMQGELVQFPHVSDPAAVTPMMVVNRTFRWYDYQFTYDFHTLESLLLKAGFSQVRRQQFGHGILPTICFDSPDRQCESLYVEAIKDPSVP